LIAAVEAGGGLAVVSESVACIAGTRLKLTPLSPAPEPFIVGASWSKAGLSSSAQRFLQAAKEFASPNQA
jgi:DNA-binding transcriptional LysR family regulator